MNSKLVSVSKHERNWVSRTIHHSALAVIENYDPTDQSTVTSEISIKSGYHPAGYGLYHRFTNFTPTENENEYLVRWQTSDSCD